MNPLRTRDFWLCLTLLCALAAILSAVNAVPLAVSHRDRLFGRLLDPSRLLADPGPPDPDLVPLAIPVVTAVLALACHRRYQRALACPPPAAGPVPAPPPG